MVSLKPQKIIGVNFENTNFFFIKRRKKYFFISSIFSSLSLFNLNNLLIRAKTPFLHHTFLVHHLSSIKNRTIVILKSGIHILEFFIPLTRILYSFGKINFFFSTDSWLLFYDQFTKKIIVTHMWTFEIVFYFSLHNNPNYIQLIEADDMKIIVLILTDKNQIEIKSSVKTKYESKIFCIPLCNLYFLKYINTLKFCIFGLHGNKIVIYDLKKRKKVCKINFKTSKETFKSIDVSFSKKLIIFQYKKIIILLNVIKKILKKIKAAKKSDKIYFITFLFNFGLFLNLNFSKKILHSCTYHSKKNFTSFVSRFGNEFPLIGIKRNKKNNLIAYINTLGNIFICTSETIKKIFLKIFFKKKYTVRIKSFCVKFLSEKRAYIVVIFYRFYRPCIWKTSAKSMKKIEILSKIKFKKYGKITSFCFTENAKFLLVAFRKNMISLISFRKNKFLYRKKHHILKNNTKCNVVLFFYEERQEFFLSGCSCGFIVLWRKYNLKKFKHLKIKKNFYLLKGHCESGLIVIVTKNHQIQIISLETFSIIKKCIGHNQKINCILVTMNFNFLISSSFDKTIKIWNLFQNKCEFTLRFLHPVLNLLMNKFEDTFISNHRFTIGLGSFFFLKKSLICNILKTHANLIEKSKKTSLYVFFLQMFSSHLSFNLVYKQSFLTQKHTKPLACLKKYKKKLSASIFFKVFSFDRLNYIRVKKFFQMKKSHQVISALNLIIFFLETYLDKITCSLKKNECIDIFYFFSSDMLVIFNLKNNLKVNIKQILVECSRKNLKLEDFL